MNWTTPTHPPAELKIALVRQTAQEDIYTTCCEKMSEHQQFPPEIKFRVLSRLSPSSESV